MARKPAPDGGRRDDIIRAALALFLKNGYESTSVRMILDEVGGEVGMFYHYFRSKDKLFDSAVEMFFEDYRRKFAELADSCSTRDEFISAFLIHLEDSEKSFDILAGNMHWTMQAAMSSVTIRAMIPTVAELIQRFGYPENTSAELVASQLLYAVSGTIHSGAFRSMTQKQRRQAVTDLTCRLLT